jgi:hypothetical protein
MLTRSKCFLSDAAIRLPAKEFHRFKNIVFWDVTPCGSCKNRRFGSVLLLLVTTNVIPCWPILVILMKQLTRSYETSVLTRAARFNIKEDAILHNHQREKLTSYIALTGWAR